MKKLTGIVAISFMAGMIGGGIGERVADEVWATKTAHAAASSFSPENCSEMKAHQKVLLQVESIEGHDESREGLISLFGVLVAERC